MRGEKKGEERRIVAKTERLWTRIKRRVRKGEGREEEKGR